MRKKTSYKQMLVESLIDISSMQNYKSPADKVLNATDEKYETFRSATSEVDVLGRAYAAQDDVENNIITEGNDMDEENLAQGEPDVKVSLPDGHEPPVSDVEDNIDESDPDKEYQEPITGEKDFNEQHLTEDAEEPFEDGEEEDEEDLDDEGTITEPSDDIPDEDEFQNADPEIATEGDEEFDGSDLPEDEPMDDEGEDDEFADDGANLPEDEPFEDDNEEVIEDDTAPADTAEKPVQEGLMGAIGGGAVGALAGGGVAGTMAGAAGGSILQNKIEEDVEEPDGSDLPEDEPFDDAEPTNDDAELEAEEDNTPLDDETLPEDEPLDDDDNLPEDDGVTVEDEDPDALGDDLPEDEPVDPIEGDGPVADPNTEGELRSGEDTVVPADTAVEESFLFEQDVTMDPNAALGAAPAPAAPPATAVPPAPPADPNAAAAPADPNAAPADPNDPNAAPVDPNDPNAAPVDPNDPNAVAEDPNAEEQDPILDVDSNVVASDTTQPQPTTESVMESLISELGSYVDSGTSDIKDLLEQDIDD